MFCSSQQTAVVSNKQIFPAPVQEAVFSFRKGLVPPRDHEVFFYENHLPGKKIKFFCGKYFSFWMPLQNPISFIGV